MSVSETLILLLVLLIGVIEDYRSKRISNKLILTGLALLMLVRLFKEGPIGLLRMLPGLLIPLLVLFILFYLGMFGGGDIKLFALTGAVTGLGGIIACIVYSFLYGALFSLIKIIYKKNLFIRLHYLADYFTNLTKTKRRQAYYIPEEGDGNIICFSPCILLGFVSYLITGGV